MPSDVLRKRLEGRSDDELIEILRQHDTEEWQAAVFPLTEKILRDRGVAIAQVLAAAAEPEVRPTDESMVTIATFATVVESEACRSALLAAGFQVVGADTFTLQVNPALGPALGGVHLAVPTTEAEEASAFLAAAERGELSTGLLVCAACGSSEVAADRTVNRSGTFLNTLLVGPVVNDVTVTFQCRSCGAAWE